MQEDNICLPLILSIPFSLIVGLMLVCTLGCLFFPSFIQNPFVPIFIYSYTVYPLCKYKFNYSKAFPNFSSLIGRWIIAHFLSIPLIILERIGATAS